MNYLGNNDLREQSISGRVDEGRVGIKARKLCWLMSESPLLAARLPSCWDSCELGLRVVLECVKCPLVLVCFAHCWANSHFTAWNSYPGKRKHTELESCQYLYIVFDLVVLSYGKTSQGETETKRTRTNKSMYKSI